jgi:hypothetical protein
MCGADEGPCMKRVVKFFLDSSLELEELDFPPLVHSRTMLAVDFRQLGTLVMLWFELHFGTNPPLGILMI